jgi:hypothetical protein
MASHTLRIPNPRPYFAEVPHYLWGQVNYDSDGDCERPTDRDWKSLSVRNRETGVSLEINCDEDGEWSIDGPEPDASRLVRFLVCRSGAQPAQAIPFSGGDIEARHERGIAVAATVAKEFESPQLKPFDSHLFWGSWKWVGWFGTDFTWVGRWIMHAVVRNDTRAVPLCIDWLKQGTCSERQSEALRDALKQLTGAGFGTDGEWLQWYEGAPGRPGQKARYPEPDFDAWLSDLKAQCPPLG